MHQSNRRNSQTARISLHIVFICQRATTKVCATPARWMLTHAERRRRFRRQARYIGPASGPVNLQFELFKKLQMATGLAVLRRAPGPNPRR
jgi:hypothetical protein